MDKAAWPALPYDEFKSTQHLLHMGVQIIGKLKLFTPFEPHWSNVALWLTTRGLTTGAIPYGQGIFAIDLDFIGHQVRFTSSWGSFEQFNIESMSVAQFAEKVFAALAHMQIKASINYMPQEITNPIKFNEDTTQQYYDRDLATAWWQILVSSYRVMQRYHARFDGETPAVGLMWGTFDLRDARYNGIHIPTTGANAGYIRRNAMNEAQIEVGFWSGSEMYSQPAYFSFTYPQPEQIENAKIKPDYARWDKTLSEFILDYDQLRKAADPEADLLAFFESTYQAGAKLAHWDEKLVTSGEPV